jgi:hypothetical protein
MMTKGKTRKEIAARRRMAEAKVMEALVEAASSGLMAPTNEALQDMLGCQSTSTPVSIVQSLEKRGLVRVERYQRARRITIVATGRATSVSNTAPHWRARPKSIPVLPEREILRRNSDFSDKILSAAKRERVDLPEFMLRLMWSGWLLREASIQDQSDAA